MAAIVGSTVGEVRVCVTQFHPVEASYNTALLDATLTGLAAHEVTLFRFADGEQPTVADLEAAEALVAVHPTWWGGIPAQMLHWVQTTLGPWIDGPAPSATSPLRTVTSLSVVTSHGSPRWTNRLQGEPGRQLWGRRVAPICAAGTRLDWLALYNIDRCDAAARSSFLTAVEARMAALGSPTIARARG
jgi:putative NADPH-quinone reductase